MSKIQNIKWNSQKIVEMAGNGVGTIISYYGEKFEVEKARENGYGAIEATNLSGRTVGMDYNQEFEVLGTFNI